MKRYKTILPIVFTLGIGTAYAVDLGAGGNVGAGVNGGINNTTGAIGAGAGARGDVGISVNAPTLPPTSNAPANSNGLPSTDRDVGLDRATDRADRLHQKGNEKVGKLKSRAPKLPSGDANANGGADVN